MTSPHRPLRLHLGLFYLLGSIVLTGLLVFAMASPTGIGVGAASGVLLLLLLLGGAFLRRVPRLHPELERQLVAIANGQPIDRGSLRLVQERDQTGAGWNHLVSYLHGVETLQSLEHRLEQTLQGSRGSVAGGVMDTLPDGVLVTNLDMVIRDANQPARYLLGLPEDIELAGKPLTQVLPLDSERNATLFRDRTAEPFRPVSFDLYRGNQVGDGVLRISRIPKQESEGPAVTQVWTVRDVTQQKLADKARDDFVGTATHELRTPLTNILCSCEMLLLEDDLDVESQKEFLNVVNSEALRLSSFVDELLDVSRMEAGAMTMHIAETDVLKLLREITGRVEPQMEEKQITFLTKCPAKLPKVPLDKDKFVAALINLLGNAAKYTPIRGEVRLEVAVEDREMVFSVEDNGFGISEADQERLFEKFYRSEDDRVREVSGSGLGLAFSRETIRRQGGDIELESELDRGSIFRIRMPLPAEAVV